MEKTPIPEALQPAPPPPPPEIIERPAGRDCSKCSFYGALHKTTGICRLHPPVPVAQLVAGADGKAQWLTNAIWPTAIEGQWCGQFKPALDG